MIKYLLSLSTICCAMTFIKAQSESLSDLQLKKVDFQKRIKSLGDSIIITDKKIAKLNSKKALSEVQNIKIEALIVSGGKIKDAPTPVANIIETLAEERKVFILDYVDEYFKVCDEQLCGYVSTLWIASSPEIVRYIEDKKFLAAEIKLENANRHAKANEVLNKKREDVLIKKLGAKTYNSLKEGNFWLGMTSEMAVVAFGSPNEINETVGSWGKHEQWVYHNIYLYFENGKLTSYQR